jgi:hypothetical protein
MSGTYEKIFGTLCEHYHTADATSLAFCARVATNPADAGLSVSLSLADVSPAARVLRTIDTARSPLDKLRVIGDTVAVLVDGIRTHAADVPPEAISGDDMVPLMLWLMGVARLPHIVATATYLQAFSPTSAAGQSLYYIATFVAAAEYAARGQDSALAEGPAAVSASPPGHSPSVAAPAGVSPGLARTPVGPLASPAERGVRSGSSLVPAAAASQSASPAAAAPPAPVSLSVSDDAGLLSSPPQPQPGPGPAMASDAGTPPFLSSPYLQARLAHAGMSPADTHGRSRLLVSLFSPVTSVLAARLAADVSGSGHAAASRSGTASPVHGSDEDEQEGEIQFPLMRSPRGDLSFRSADSAREVTRVTVHTHPLLDDGV